MVGRREMHDGGLGVTLIGSERHQLIPIDELPSRLATTRQLKRQYLTKTILLTRRQRVIRMVSQPAVVNGSHKGLLNQPLSQTLRVVRVSTRPQVPRFRPR